MTILRPVALAAFALLAASALRAQPAAVPDPAPAGGSGRGGEPNVRQTVIEDEGSRIEELRVRGETQRISVQPKHGGARYEVLPAGGGRDLGVGPTTPRGAVGQRVWRVLQF